MDERSVELGSINQLGAAAYEVRCIRGEMRFELKNQPLAALAAESALTQVLEKLDARIRFLLAEMATTQPTPDPTARDALMPRA